MNNITNFLGLQGIELDNFSEDKNNITLSVHTPVSPQRCPCCGKTTSYVHGYRTQKVKDLPMRLKNVTIILKKRRYICKECNKTFFEKYSFLPKYHRGTNRRFLGIIQALNSSRSLKDIALSFNSSTNTVQRMLKTLSSPPKNLLPLALGIDEFKGNTNKEKYQCILTDLTTGNIFDILPNRNKSYLIEYFKQFSNRNEVKFFVMDMTNNYKSLAFLFPNAKIIADRYHYVRQVYWALDNVRKRIQKAFIKDKRIYFKHSRKLLFKDYDKLKDDEKQALFVMLSQSEELHTAWQLKEDFKYFRQTTNRKDAERELLIWILEAEESGLLEFKAATTAFHNWGKCIVNSVVYKYSNGITEGFNNKIKVLKRNAYGYRNFDNFRTRIILNCTKFGNQACA